MANVNQPSDAAYLDALRELCKAWNVSDAEMLRLLGVRQASLYRWRLNSANLSDDQRDLISHLANIQLALEETFGENSMVAEWLRRSNDAFDGHTPLDVMMNGRSAGIVRVRTYLEQVR